MFAIRSDSESGTQWHAPNHPRRQVTEADVVAALSDPSAAPAFRESYGDVVYHVLSAGIARRAESSSTAHTPPEAPAVDHAAP